MYETSTLYPLDTQIFESTAVTKTTVHIAHYFNTDCKVRPSSLCTYTALALQYLESVSDIDTQRF